MAGEPVTAEDIGLWRTKLSNHGRWGPEDRRGTLNLIDDAGRATAARLVKSGLAVSCARPLATRPALDNPRPVIHTIVQTRDPDSAQDHLGIAAHGYSVTHLDALCHVSRKGLGYNGFAAAPVRALLDSPLGVSEMRDGICGRGVLLDVAERAQDGTPGYLESGTAVGPEMLDRAAERAGVSLGPGDIVLVRTGRWRQRDLHGPWDASRRIAGLGPRCLPWLRAHDVAVLGTDGVADVVPSTVEGEPEPIHDIAIVTLGLPLLDNLDLERLAVECHSANRWEFFLAIGPLVVAHGTGSPVNPIAIL